MIEVLHIMQQLENNYKQNQMTNLLNNEVDFTPSKKNMLYSCDK